MVLILKVSLIGHISNSPIKTFRGKTGKRAFYSKNIRANL